MTCPCTRVRVPVQVALLHRDCFSTELREARRSPCKDENMNVYLNNNKCLNILVHFALPVQAASLHPDRFFTELREASDGFSVVAEAFGRGLMNVTPAAAAAAAAVAAAAANTAGAAAALQPLGGAL